MKLNPRIAKYALFGAGIIILLIIVSSRLIFSSDRLTALVLPRISQLLNREVSAEQVELSIFPTIGIRITGFRVSNPEYRKFDSPYLLDAKAVVIDAKILPLLKNRLEINNVIFYSPTIFIERNTRGRLNTDRLLSESFYRQSQRARGSLSSLLLSNFEISNGNVIWYDSRTGISAKFLNIDFTSRIKTVVEEDKLVLNSRLMVERCELWKNNSNIFNGNTIEAVAKLDYDKRHDMIHIQSDRMSVFGISLRSGVDLGLYPQTQVSLYAESSDSSAATLYGILPEFLQKEIVEKSMGGTLGIKFRYIARGAAPLADLYASVNDFDAALKSGDSLRIKEVNIRFALRGDSSSFHLYVPSALLGENFVSVDMVLSPPQMARARILADIELRKLAHSLGISNVNRFSGSMRARYDFDYNFATNKAKAKGLVVFQNALIQVPVGIDTLYRGEFDGSISLLNNRATINKMLVRLGASDMVLAGTLTNYQGYFLAGKNIIPSLKLTIASRTFSTIGLLPHMILNLGRESLGWLPTANVSLLFNVGKFVLSNDTLTRVTGSMDILDYFVRVNKLNYTSSVGTFSVSGWTDYSQSERTSFSLRTKVLTSNFGRLVRRYLGRVDITGGSGDASIALTGVLDDSGRVDLATLGGKGQLKVTGTALKGYSVLKKLYSFLGAEGRDSVKISNTTFSFDITDGRVYFNKMIAYGRPFDFRLDGWHGFDGTLDYKLTLRVYPPLGGIMEQFLKPSYPDLATTSDGTLALSLVAGGTTSDARFTIVALGGRIAAAPRSASTYLSLSK